MKVKVMVMLMVIDEMPLIIVVDTALYSRHVSPDTYVVAHCHQVTEKPAQVELTIINI